jgi:hypothetical protein
MMPYVENQTIDVIYTLSNLPYNVSATPERWIMIVKIILLLSTLWGALIYEVYTGWIMLAFIGSAIYMSLLRMNIYDNMTYPFKYNFLSAVRSRCELLENIKQYLPDDRTIYVIDDSDRTDHQSWYRYQYVCYDVHIVPGLPKDVNGEAIIIANAEIDSLYLHDYAKAKLSDSEYVYCKGDYYLNLLEGKGVEFVEDE